jgi:hypothetical protein
VATSRLREDVRTVPFPRTDTARVALVDDVHVVHTPPERRARGRLVSVPFAAGGGAGGGDAASGPTVPAAPVLSGEVLTH